MPVYTSSPSNVIVGTGGVIVAPPTGNPGIPGANRYIPPGGTTGQVLEKSSNNDYDVDWANGGGGDVTSVNAQTGVVVLDTGDIASVADSRYVTDAQLVVIGNTSGTNTGDQTNITGNAATVTTNANLTGVVTSVGNATSIANGAISNAMLANGAVANLSGTNTGDQTNITGNAATVTTNANLTGVVTSVGNATSIANGAISNAMLANAAVANLSGTNTGDQTISDATISITDIVTNNASASAHGFLPKLSNVATEYLNGQGGWTTPSSGDVTGPASAIDNNVASFNLTTGKIIKDSGVAASLIGESPTVTLMKAMGSPILFTTANRSQSEVGTTTSMVSETVYYSTFYVNKATTFTGGCFLQTVVGNYTGNNYNGMGLYLANTATGDLTLVASTTDDSELWKGTLNSLVQKAFSTPYAAAIGVYVLTAVYSSSAQTTAPTIGAYPNISSANLSSAGFANGMRLIGRRTSQTSLEASFNISSLINVGNNIFLGVY